MKQTNLTKEIFLRDVKDHRFKIIKEDSLYRHIRCSKENSSNYYFDIITWPGNLAYTGDMGSFMFSRVTDMFTFFRRNKELDINPTYWSKKVLAESRFGNGITEFSVDEFEKSVLQSVRSHLDLDEDEKIPAEILKELDYLLNSENEYECVENMRHFRSDKINFDDFWEYDCQVFTYHFLWCCYAIVWAIGKYDELKLNGLPLEVRPSREKGGQ